MTFLYILIDLNAQLLTSSILQDDEDVYILSKISDIVHALFGTMGTDFLPVFDQLLEHFVRLLKPEGSWPDRQWGLCIFDDLLEYTGPVSNHNNIKQIELLIISVYVSNVNCRLL